MMLIFKTITFYIMLSVSTVELFVDGSGDIISEYYFKTLSYVLPSTFHTENGVISKFACCSLCNARSECFSVNYDVTARICQLSETPYVYVTRVATPSPDWDIYSKQNVWALAFRGTPGSGVDPYVAWLNATSVTTNDVTCKQLYTTSCTQHHRHPLVDEWSFLSVGKVRYSLHKDGQEMAYVTFNGTATDALSWFQASQVIESSWTDLLTEPHIYFSPIGHGPSRRFFINRNYGGCPSDAGWTVALKDNSFGCNYDQQASYPQFLFSNGTTYVNSETEFDTADIMAIHIME